MKKSETNEKKEKKVKKTITKQTNNPVLLSIRLFLFHFFLRVKSSVRIVVLDCAICSSPLYPIVFHRFHWLSIKANNAPTAFFIRHYWVLPSFFSFVESWRLGVFFFLSRDSIKQFG